MSSGFEAELASQGFDVLRPLSVSWYNDYIKGLGLSTDSTKYLEKSGEAHASGEAAPFALSPLPDYGRNGDALAFIIEILAPCGLASCAGCDSSPTRRSRTQSTRLRPR